MTVRQGQSWNDCDATIKAYVNKIVETIENLLKGNLTGIYLHGSLSMGSYFPTKSDIDLLVVVNNSLTPSQRKKFSLTMNELSNVRPTIGDIELSVVTKDALLNFTHPLPYELHFSSEWKERIENDEIDYSENKTDPDLAAHCFSIQKRGICLTGQPIAEIFSTPFEYYKEAVLDDFKWIIEGENIAETPFYGVLNCCRILYLLSENSPDVISKSEGAEWAFGNLPSAYHPVIKKALEVYQSSDAVSSANRRTGGKIWDKASLLQFRDFAAAEAEKYEFEIAAQKV